MTEQEAKKLAEVRERLVAILAGTQYDEMNMLTVNYWYLQADKILSDPDILVKADDQTLPEAIIIRKLYPTPNIIPKISFTQEQLDYMQQSGFVRVCGREKSDGR